MEWITAGALVTTALWLFLVIMVVIRKGRRDRRERGARERRDRFWEAVGSDDREALRAVASEAIGSQAMRVDLLALLSGSHELDARAYSAIQATFIESGLAERLATLAGSRDPVQRGCAVLLLGRARLPAAVSAGIPLLADDDLDVRLAACAALASAHSPQAAVALIDAIGQPGLQPGRLIERLAAEWAAPTVLRALQADDLPSSARVALIRALGLARHGPAAGTLRECLLADDPEQRISAARSLGQIEDAEATAPLLTALDDQRWEVRAQAARSLGLIGDPVAVPRLAECLTDSAWWVRANAGNALRILGELGLATLEEVARTSSDRFARDRARESIALAAAAEGGLT